MPMEFNEAQQAILDREWDLHQRIKDKKPPRRRSLMISIMCSRVGPEVSSQNVGK